MLAMKTNTRPPRIDHLGSSIVTNVEETVAIAPLNTAAGRMRTAATTVLKPYRSWYKGMMSWKNTTKIG